MDQHSPLKPFFFSVYDSSRLRISNFSHFQTFNLCYMRPNLNFNINSNQHMTSWLKCISRRSSNRFLNLINVRAQKPKDSITTVKDTLFFQKKKKR